MELSAVQPPHKPKGAAQQTCPPTMPLKTSSPSSHRVPHRYIGGCVRDRGDRQGKEMLTQETSPVGMATGGDNLGPERGNEYPKVSLSAKAVTGAFHFSCITP